MRPDWPEEEVVLWAEGKLQMSPKAVQLFQQPRPPWQDWIGRITCPIPLITSDLDRRALHTLEEVQEMASLLREGKAVRIKGTGHLIHSDQILVYMQAEPMFLAEVEARRAGPGWRSGSGARRPGWGPVRARAGRPRGAGRPAR